MPPPLTGQPAVPPPTNGQRPLVFKSFQSTAHRRHRLRWTLISVGVVLAVIVGTIGWVGYRAISVINTRQINGGKISFFSQLKHIVTAGDQPINGEAEDRINILLLGYGGPGHDGPYLTDTMMVASFQPSTKHLALISIPRDLVVDIPGYGYRKINNVLSFGRDSNYPGGGEVLTAKVVSDLLDIPIQYYARIDFTGFQEIIDRLGGVNVTVDQTFTDYEYPNNSYGYETVKFLAGPQTMNGDQALKFARSRHGNNGEGSDFARSARQQKIILALKDKLLSFGTLSNPKKVSDILGSLGTHSQTNMEVWEMLRLGHLIGSLNSSQVDNVVIDDSTNGLLEAATGSGGAFILVPRDKTYQDISFLAKNVFLVQQAAAEKVPIAVVNATSLTGLAQTTNIGLLGFGLSVTKVSSLVKAASGQTVIIDPNPGAHPATDRLLSLYRHAAGVISPTNWSQSTGDFSLPELLTKPNGNINVNRTGNTNTYTAQTPAVILVLGLDQPKTITPVGLPVSSYSGSTTNANTNKSTNTNAAKTNTNSAHPKTNSNSTNTTIHTSGKSVNTNTVIISNTGGVIYGQHIVTNDAVNTYTKIEVHSP